MKTDKFPYKDAKYEYVKCDFCQEDNFEVLRKKDRNNLNVRTCICKNCGLIYINPRMTKEYYDLYYNYEYRDQMLKFRGEKKPSNDFEKRFEISTRHGEALAKMLKNIIKVEQLLKLGQVEEGS